MLTKVKDLDDLLRYLDVLDHFTPIDVFERPDDNEMTHTYVATGMYRGSMADYRIFSGYAIEAIKHFTSKK